MRTCVQDNKRIQDNERIPYTKRETDTSYIPTTTITIEIKTETRTEITTEKTTEITSETKKPHIRDLDLKKGMYTCRATAIELRAVWTKKTKKIRQTDKSYLIMQLFICITRPERTILANYVQRSGPRCQAKHDGQRDQRSYDSTGWYDFQTSTNRTDNSNKFTTNQQVPQKFPLNAPRCRSVICIRHISPPTCRHYDDNSTN